ncbi:MAG TPA: hypothetical protein VKR54_05155 [Candidatus Babeliales bacterium]|jgi:hypothetical protein|nr:hypothetical protein [Candidatus Babeliales bacterium]
MKINSFCLLPIALFGALQAGINGDELIVSFAQNGAYLHSKNECYQESLPSEKNLRKRLYWLDQHNPHYFLLDDFQDDFNYYIAVLTDHIKVLENKISQQKNGLSSMAMLRGLGFDAFSTLCGFGAYYGYKIKKDNAAGLYCGIMSAIFGVAAVKNYYKVWRYAERLIARLERDKRILVDLKREKAAKEVREMMKQ